MRPLPTRPSDDAGAADQGPPAGDQPLPAPPPPPDPLAAASAAPHKRGAMRRRLRKLRRERTDQLAKLGTLVIDARRRANGSQPEVVERRTAEVAELDRQVRELAHAVDPHRDSRELASGIAGGCRECGALLSTEDRFCPACGTPTNPRRKRPEATDAAPAVVSAPPPIPGTAATPAATASAPAPPPIPGTAQQPAAPPPPATPPVPAPPDA